MSEARAPVASVRRIVIKLGSSSLVGTDIDAKFSIVAEVVVALRGAGRQAALVSSGAVALGREALGLSARPAKLSALQACAAVGQSRLMQRWEKAFSAHGVAVGQVLLSHADLAERERYLNAEATVLELDAMDVVPVINENDTVAVDEIRFGDNDQLAARVTGLFDAGLLVLVTDVDGLHDEGGRRVGRLDDVERGQAWVRAPADPMSYGSGGMASKLRAAQIASEGGAHVVIGQVASTDELFELVGGGDRGTWVPARATSLSKRKHWLAYSVNPRGDLFLDDGAVDALCRRGSSLLPAGVVGVRGNFAAGDAVRLRDRAGREIGRGLSRYATSAVAALAGAQTEDIIRILGYHGGDEVVHRDDLVVLTGTSL